jgi:proteasome accessory factor C
MAKTNTAERARRLIALMGHLTKDARYRVEDLAAAVGTSPAELTADLEALSMCGTDDLDPYSMVPIMIENGEVEVYGPMPALGEPVRLSPAEAVALATALQTVGFAPSDPLVIKLLAATSTDFDAQSFAHTIRTTLAGHETSIYLTLADGAHTHHVVEIEHVRVGGDEPVTRPVEPLSLFAERGAWYLTAWCRMAGDWRTFRLERIRRATRTDEPFDPAAHGSPGPESTAFRAAGLPVATLAFSAEEPYVEREWPGSRLLETGEGSLTTVEIPYGGTDWLARRVLARLGAVRVVEPAEMRDAVARMAASEGAVYRR